ncbi:RNA polymerase-binding protein RbpA [Phytoactinopolyspora mesophila]|uniref:RNA polymerase-binding protein RbpA n=1 Tax=Phytoactinopolyspora mesophila TaxID=2650750 RepID=A0A7K3LX01_9ACTN|nr:RNA polymerase-binding protein RbpA [Phytoactinopolyspora mesophila]
MAGGNAIRGSRVGAGPMGEDERGDSAPRRQVTYYCTQGHVSAPFFSMEADVPESWDCLRCGSPASQDQANPPPSPRAEPYKTHLAYVKERRSDEDGAAILEEALAALRQRRRL